MLSKKVAKTVEARAAAAAAILVEFCRIQAIDPIGDVERAVIAIGKDRMAFLDGQSLPDWVRFPLSIDGGAPISSDEVLRALKVLRDDGYHALIEAVMICQQGGGRRINKSIRLQICRHVFEPAFRAALSASTPRWVR